METKQQFLAEMYNITSKIEKEFGHWLVTSEGDVINYKYPYPIYSYQMNEDTWLAQLREKAWFSKEEESHFLEAFKYACAMLKIKVVLKEEY